MSKGSILIYTSAAGQAAPLPSVTLTVTDAGGSVRARLVTDADGFAEATDLPAPDAAYSPVSYTHLRAHETDSYLVCRLLLEKKKKKINK